MDFGFLKWLRLIRIAAVLMAILSISLIIFASIIMKNQTYVSTVKCKSQMKEIYQAIERYRDTHNDNYPPSLEVLQNEYLKDSSILKCPNDKSSSGKSSYVYHIPTDTSRENDILLECNNHTNILGKKINPIIITISGSEQINLQLK